MDVLREREVKDSLERQLQDEQKVRGEYKIQQRDFTERRELFAERQIQTNLSIQILQSENYCPPCFYAYRSFEKL